MALLRGGCKNGAVHEDAVAHHHHHLLWIKGCCAQENSRGIQVTGFANAAARRCHLSSSKEMHRRSEKDSDQEEERIANLTEALFGLKFRRRDDLVAFCCRAILFAVNTKGLGIVTLSSFFCRYFLRHLHEHQEVLLACTS